MKITHYHNSFRWALLWSMGVVLLCLGACRKLVDIDQPQGTITSEKAFSNNADAEAVLSGIYSSMMSNKGDFTGINGAITLYAGLSSDELSSYAGVKNTIDYSYEMNKLYADSANTSLFWSPLYKTIYSINAALEGVIASTSTRLTDSARTQVMGECKFLRAFHYFYLANLFGDVPLVLSTDFNQTAKMQRTSQEQVYQQIIEDLKDAEELLPEDFSFVPQNERIRANKWAATALLARVYLYRNEWQNAVDAASQVIANHQFSLMGDLKQVFLKNSQESIFQLQPSTLVSPYGIYDASKFLPLIKWEDIPVDERPLYLGFFSVYEQYTTPNYYLSETFADSFEQGDKRKAQWCSYRETPTIPPYDGITIYFPYKYTAIAGPSSVPTQYYTVLRVAEQYLIRAEALAQLGDEGGVRADLNALRARADLPPITTSGRDQLLAAVAQERRVELFAEWGHRWFDLKRTGKASEVLGAISLKQPWDDRQLLYPIPPTEIQADPFLIQNPGY